MADHNKPVLTSTYANFVSELDARFDDLSLGLDPAVTSATNLPVNAIRWNSVLGKDQKWNGSAWLDKSSFYSLGSVRFNNGTVGAPSITFNDDTTTGIYKPTNQSIAIVTQGVEVLRTVNGNLLLGTTSSTGVGFHQANSIIPASGRKKVAAFGGVSSSNTTNGSVSLIGLGVENGYFHKGAIGWERQGAFDTGSIVFYNNPDATSVSDVASGNFERARITVDGNLLVGTTIDSGHKLDVNGNARISGILSSDGRSLMGGATGNDYNQGAVEIYGGGVGSPSVLPTIGFYNPGVFAGSLRQNSASNFGFYAQGGVARASLEVASLFANSQVYASDGFLTTTYLTNQRNPIWRFGDASLYGISYFQGTAGYNGKDSIGVHFGTLNGGSATGQGSHVTFNEDGIIAKRFQGVADQSNNLKVTDSERVGETGDRNLTHITPQSLERNIRADFATATVAGTGGVYAGVLTFSPANGKTESTGGPSYQLAFGSTQNNGGSPQLRLRNGIDTTWNTWVDIMTPAGAILHFAMPTAPSGYLKANGAAVSRTAYQALFDTIGTTFGSGDGSTTFNLPDLRGEFVRGWDDGRGIDTARTFGSAQSQDVQPHTHTLNPVSIQSGGGVGGSNNLVQNGGGVWATGSTGTTETRPRNIALLACIKY